LNVLDEMLNAVALEKDSHAEEIWHFTGHETSLVN
jgi:hypothetical protein